MKIGEIKENKPEAQPRVIPEVKKTPKSDIIVKIIITHRYNTSSSTKIVNHVTTFKNAPKMFQVDATEKIKHT